MMNYLYIEFVFKNGIVYVLGGGYFCIYIYVKGDGFGFGFCLRICWNLLDFIVGLNDDMLIVGGLVKVGVYFKDGLGFLLVFVKIFVDWVSYICF